MVQIDFTPEIERGQNSDEQYNRYGHTLIQHKIDLYDPQRRQVTGDYKLMDHFFHTEEYDANMTSILYGMVSQAAQEVDVNLIADLTEELFKNVDGPPGSDLASRNIQVCSRWSFWDFKRKLC